MFQTKRQLREKIAELGRRVEHLEEILCPLNEHDWKQIDSRMVSLTNGYDFDTECTYKCRRCGKVKISIL